MVMTVVTDSILISIYKKVADTIRVCIGITMEITDSVAILIYKIMVSADSVTICIHKAFPKIASSDMTGLDLLCGMNGKRWSKHDCTDKSHSQQFLHIQIPPKT